MIMYGRSAAAVARATGLPVEQCQEIIKAIQEGFPVAWKWLQDNMDAAIRDEKLRIAGGRYRYFSGAQQMSKSRQAAMRREASNCGVQGAVSYLLSRAGINFYRAKYIHKLDIDFNILLPIHDAFLFEVKTEHVPKMEKLIKLCMCAGNKLPGTQFNLGVDIELYHRWGEKLKH